MPDKIKVNLSHVIKILDKELKKVNEVRANLRCLIKVLKEVEPRDKLLFRIKSESADDGTDPCCGMCHES